MRDLLNFYKFPGDDVPVVRGSALCALNGEKPELGRDAILKLMEAVDAAIPTPERALDKPFAMPVEDTFSISGRGTVVTGRIEQGVCVVCVCVGSVEGGRTRESKERFSLKTRQPTKQPNKHKNNKHTKTPSQKKNQQKASSRRARRWRSSACSRRRAAR